MADWVSPTGNVANSWVNPTYAYDEDTGTSASRNVPADYWSTYLELTHASLQCSKVRIWTTTSVVNFSTVQVDVYYGAAWHNIYSGGWTVSTWLECPIGSTQAVTSMQVRFYNIHETLTRTCNIAEADFYEEAGTIYAKSIAAKTGSKVLYSRPLTLSRSAVVTSGSKTIASRANTLTRMSVIESGTRPAAYSRVLTLARSKVATSGTKANVSRVLALIRSQVSKAGIKANASVVRILARTILGKSGSKVSYYNRALTLVRTQIAVSGTKVNASRVLTLVRSQLAKAGTKISVLVQIIYAHIYDRAIVIKSGTKAIASRSLVLVRSKVVKAGTKAIAVKVLATAVRALHLILQMHPRTLVNKMNERALTTQMNSRALTVKTKTQEE